MNEHEQEWGGYFISKGLHKLIRLLIQTRRNYPIGVLRNVWKNRGAGFSEYGIMLHGVRPDETAAVSNSSHRRLLCDLPPFDIP